MGTQNSYRGPGDRQPLLPSWALTPAVMPEGDAAPESPGDPPAGINPEVPTPVDPMAPAVKPPEQSLPNEAARPQPVHEKWRAARGAFRRYVTGGGDRGGLGRAARAYVRAKGGPRRAARAATGGRTATARLAGFLADVARHGVEEAARRAGLASLLGRDSETVFAGIIDSIAPAGATAEEAAARAAVSDALWRVYDQLSLADDIHKLDSMDAQSVAGAIEAAIVAYIYNRWLQEVGIRLEERALTAAQAVRLERDVKDYTRESVRMELENIDVLAVDWRRGEGRQFVERKYTEAYNVFGGS